MNIGLAIKTIRTAKGRKQREVARAVGICYPHMCDLEKGRYSPSVETLSKIMSFLKVPMCVVFLLSEEVEDELIDMLKAKYITGISDERFQQDFQG